MRDYRNILVVRTDRMGDVVLTTPAIAALRKACPHAKLTILVKPFLRDLVEGNPNLDEVMVDDRAGVHGGILGYIRIVKELRRRRFDLAVIFHTKKRTNSICFFAGIPQRAGYYNNKFGFLLTTKVKDTRHLGLKHESDYCLDLLKHLGIDASGVQGHVPLHKESEGWAGKFLRENHVEGSDRLVAVHPGAGDSARKWPAKQFAQVIDFLKKEYSAKIIFIGDKKTEITVSEIRKFTNTNVIDLTGKTTISQLSALLKRCHLLVSNESGPVHIADVLGTPVISIFTRNQPGINPERWRPLGKSGKFVSVKSDHSISFAKADQVDPKTLEPLPTQEVLEAVDALLRL